MKRVKSLLLGSAAGVVAVAGAHAADLPIKAKPVDYVKICSLYGDGFFYIPGTETCVRFGGSVQGDYYYNAAGNGHPHYDLAPGAQDRTVSAWDQRGRVDIGFDSRTQTAYGTLRSFGQLRLDNADGAVTPNATRAFMQWAGFTFGHTKSYTDPEGSWGGGAGFKILTQAQIHADTGANGTNQIAYSWELGNGMVLVFGANERRPGPLPNLSDTNAFPVGGPATSARAGMMHPDPYVAWRGSQAWGTWSAAIMAIDNNALYYDNDPSRPGSVPCPAVGAQSGTTQCAYPSDKWGFAWLSGFTLKLPWFGEGDRIGGFFNYGTGSGQHTGGVNVGSADLFQGGNNVALGVKTDSVYVNGGALQLTTSWSFGGAFEHYWVPNFSTTLYAGRSSIEYNSTVINSRLFCGGNGASPTQRIRVAATTVCDPSFKVWQAGVHTDWYPVPGFRLAAEVSYIFVETAFEGQQVTLTQATGARPTGVYTAKDAGIAVFVARAQRGFGGIGE